MSQHRKREVRRRAETEKANAFASLNACYADASKSDDSRTEQGCGVQIVKSRRKRIHEVGSCQNIFGVAAIHGVSREHGRIAEILETPAAIRTHTIHTAQPGNSNSHPERKRSGGAIDYFPDDLMPRNQRLSFENQLTFDDVQVSPANSASTDSQQNVSRRNLRLCDFCDLQRPLPDFLRII
jgi:hypothetical protein